MKNSSCFHARPFIIWTGFFYLFLAADPPQFVHAQPPKWDINIFRSINNSRSNFLDAIVGTNDYSVLPLAIATPVVFSRVGLAEKDGYAFDTGS
jgi:hypothetical protein